MIVDAPVGATAAMLGSGISVGSALAAAGNSTANLASSSTINNHITAYATTGDAIIEHNTSAPEAP